MKGLNFKAWDKQKEVWTNFQIQDNRFYFIDKFTGVWVRDDYFKRFNLVQYTGLQDKHGKEIYEGDILKYNIFPTYSYAIKPVLYHKDGYIVRSEGENEWGDSLWDCTVAGCEIIGNIYEDKHLLEDDSND